MKPVAPAPSPPDVVVSTTRPPALIDPRFRALLSAADWADLPAPIRQRFSKRLAGGESVVYRGEVVEARMSRIGRWLAQAARLFGGPLPLSSDVGAPAIVTVTEDIVTRGQHWTRLYVRRDGFPQIIHSSKRFAGPTGLEEYVGASLGMALSVHVATRALVFRGVSYHLDIFGLRLALPRWLTPGELTVTHQELGDRRFLFDLKIVHPRFGELIRQKAIFRETTP